MDGKVAIGDHEVVCGLNIVEGEFVLWMPPHTNTFPSGSKTALARLLCSPSGNGTAGPQLVAGESEVVSMISYVLLVEGSAPPTTRIRTYGGELLISMTDMPFVRSGMEGETGAMSFQTPVSAPVNAK